MPKYIGIKSFYYLIVLTMVAMFFYTVQSLFIPLLIAFLLANVLKPLVSYFELKGYSQLSVISSIFLIMISLVVILFTFLTPLLIKQVATLSDQLPQYIEVFKTYVLSIQSSLKSEFTFISFPDMTELSKEYIANKGSGFTKYLSSYLSNALSLLSFALIIPFISFFILKDMYLMQKTLLSYVPNRYFEMFVLLFYKIGNSIQAYIRGQLIDASFVGVMTAVGLSIIGFPYALVVGLIAGIGNFVPYFGPILGAIPAIFIMFVTPEWSDASSIMMVVGVFLVVQVIETIFVYPLAVGNSVNLHPLLILLSLLVGGSLGGIVGMIIVRPLVAILKVTFELLYKYLSEYKILT